jgi:hypothetical protein
LRNILTIIVDPDIESLSHSDVARDVESISIGRELSEFLVKEAESDRTQATIKWLETTLREKTPGPIVCADIDLLFHPSLGLDPLVLFRRISRYTKLIVLWPGTYKDGVLSYAVPEHKHYRFWKNLEGIEIMGVNDAL